MTLSTKPIETKRLILRPFEIEDAEAMYENWASDPEATRYMSWPTHSSLEVTRAYVKYAIAAAQEGREANWLITRKPDGEVIGSIGAIPKNPRARSVSAGYIIMRKYWRQGITSEAFAALIDYLFRACGVLRIEALHDVRNPGSGAVMKKCGLRLEGISRKSEANNAGICDTAHYAILKEDYL